MAINIAPDEWINARDLGRPRSRPHLTDEDRTDKVISQIVGRRIMKTDPRLLKLVVEEQRHLSEEAGDHLLEIPSFINKLKQTLS